MTIDPVIRILVDNLPLLCNYLRSSPIQKIRIPVGENEVIFEIPPVIETTVGKVHRSGIVKIKLVQLIECLMDKRSVSLVHPVIMREFHSLLLVCLFRAF